LCLFHVFSIHEMVSQKLLQNDACRINIIRHNFPSGWRFYFSIGWVQRVCVKKLTRLLAAHFIIISHVTIDITLPLGDFSEKSIKSQRLCCHSHFSKNIRPKTWQIVIGGGEWGAYRFDLFRQAYGWGVLRLRTKIHVSCFCCCALKRSQQWFDQFLDG